MSIFLRLVREPLVHFMLVGAVIFGLYQLINPSVDASAATETITVSEATRSQLESQFTKVWNRSPTPDEMEGLLSSYIREEVLVREALKLSLDRNDPVVRQRLAQKMEFLLQSMASAKPPSEEELRSYFEQNADAYRSVSRFGIDQVFLEETASQAEIDVLLGSLRDGADHTLLGQRSLLPTNLPPSSARSIDAMFGTGFSDQLSEIEPGEWAGPISSGFGQHLVRVTDARPSQVPELESIRDRVEADMRRDNVDASIEEQFRVLSEGFEIRRDDEGSDP